MPELPEVETVTLELRESVEGLVLENCEIFRESYLRGQDISEFVKGVTGKRVLTISRRGKYIIWTLDKGMVMSHLGMTGKYMKLQVEEEIPKHTPALFRFAGIRLILNDVRRFGRINYYGEGLVPEQLTRLGIEPLSEDFTAGYLAEAFAGRKRSVKDLLMDQHIIAGLGNIYVSEILFRAGINPLTKGKEVQPVRIEWLVKETGEVLHSAIKHNGTTISDYKRVDAKSGEFQNFLKVYGKNGEPCPNCGTAIEKVVVGGRSSFFCGKCQLI